MGQVANKAEMEAAHERLMASGVFDRVAYRYAPAKDAKGVAVTFEVVESNAFYPILFEDLGVDQAQLRAWLKQKDPLFGPKIPATKESLAHYTALVEEYLTAHNAPQALTARLSSENPPDLVILMRPATQRPVVGRSACREHRRGPGGCGAEHPVRSGRGHRLQRPPDAAVAGLLGSAAL